MSRALGIDYGDKRIGVALSDPMRIIASSLCVIENTGIKPSCAEVIALCEKHGVTQMVMGLPLNMNGTSGEAAQKAQHFAEELRKRTKIPVLMWDERLSTVSAQNALIEAGTRRENRRGLVDKVAAQIILQHWLDAQPAPEGEPQE
ncbi:MAG: Holliday junction resolvase RuvX [Kiritimatiellia bacterium]